MISNEFDNAFSGISAIVLCKIKDNEIDHIGKIAFKFPSDGQIHCYFHLFGAEMVRVCANGGYDRKSTAVLAAASLIKPNPLLPHIQRIRNALTKAESRGWDNCLKEAGITTLLAI